MGLNPEYNTIQTIIKFRQEMAEKLFHKHPDGVKWAKRIGLIHWHAVGWGCHENCLEGVGKAVDYDQFRTRRGKFRFPTPFEAKFPDDKARRKSIETRQRQAREKREGIE